MNGKLKPMHIKRTFHNIIPIFLCWLKNAVIKETKKKLKKACAKYSTNQQDIDLDGAESVLIIGAGQSAKIKKIKELIKHYDLVVTLNSAYFIYGSADIISLEMTNRSAIMQDRILTLINHENIERIIIKPFSFCALRILDKIKLILVLRKMSKLKGISHLKPKTIRHDLIDHEEGVDLYSRILADRSIPIQWRGSLSLWLDIMHINKSVKRVGLIGTDLSGSYSPEAGKVYDPFNGDDVQITNKDLSDQGGGKPILELLRELRLRGYLNDKKFEHHHTSWQLKEILNG